MYVTRPVLRARRILIAAVLFIAAGCATYTSKMQMSRDDFFDGRYDEALTGLDELISEAKGSDLFLYRLERGRVNLAAGCYDSSIVDLQAAEERFADIEGTISIPEMISSTLLHPGKGEYQPENHEKILISSYLLLAYWMRGDREGAFVERNRIVRKLGMYVNGLSEEDRNKLDIPFARYLAGLLYEAQGMEDDARIEYEIVGKLRPEAVPPAILPRATEVVVFVDLGRGPVKVSREIRGYFQREGGLLQGVFLLPDIGNPLVFNMGMGHGFSPDRLGVLFTFSFPQLVRQERYIHSCRIVVDGIEAGEAVLLDDLAETTDAAFRKNLPGILIKSAIRAYLKTLAQTKLKDKAGGAVDVLGKLFSAVDRADTRSWQTLPAEVHLFRMETTPGDHEIYVNYYDEDGNYIGSSEAVQTLLVDERGKGVAYFPHGVMLRRSRD
jgi:tetratricopeptide (TPR) repeat protein